MKRKLAAICLASLLLSLLLYVSCKIGQIQDDDSSPSDDDTCDICTTTSECTKALGAGWACQSNCCVSTDDDDDTTAATCTTIWTQMYTGCGLTFYENGAAVTLTSAIGQCEESQTPFALSGPCAACVENNPPPDACTGMQTCLQSCVNAGKSGRTRVGK